MKMGRGEMGGAGQVDKESTTNVVHRSHTWDAS
jgi:hypothetical protein